MIATMKSRISSWNERKEKQKLVTAGKGKAKMCSIRAENVMWEALFLIEDKYWCIASKKGFERQEAKIM